MNIELYRRLLAESHQAIDDGYNAAIAHYEEQKRQFINNLNAASQQVQQITASDFMLQLNREIETEIETEIDKEFDKVFDLIKKDFVDNIEKKLMGRSTAARRLKNKFRSKSDIVKEKEKTAREFYLLMIKEIELFLHSVDRNKTFIAKFANNTSNDAIQANLFGYLRKMVFERLRMGKTFEVSRTHFKTSLKGYYKEELLTDALSKVLDQYDMTAVSTGTETNQKGQQIKYDIIIADRTTLSKVQQNKENALQPIINALDSLGATKQAVGTANQPIIAGVQSKSWIEPFKSSIAKKRNWAEFGGAAAYMPDLNSTESYYWHAGVRNAMSNIIDIIGRGNIFYSTGTEIYWTADLLTQFRNEQYVLAFYKRKGRNPGDEQKIVSSGVGMMMFHEDA